MIADDDPHAIWNRFSDLAGHLDGKPAVVDAARGISLGYGALRDRAEALAGALAAREEPNVAFIGEPSVEALPLVLACARLGRCFVPLSDREPPERLRRTIAQLPGATLVAGAVPLAGLASPDPILSDPLNALNLAWSVSGPGADPPDAPWPYLVTYSSGSTGQSKPVALRQPTKLRRTQQSIGLFSITTDDCILSASPLHHSLGQRHLFCALMTGATLIKAYPFHPERWIAAVAEHRVSFAIPVATHLKLLQRSILSDPAILAPFRCIVTSSAPAEPEFKRAVLENAGFAFWEIYGMTETACATAVRYRRGDSTEHLGRAIAGSAIRIADPDTGGAGEIQVLSDCLCDGYWGDERQWNQARTADGWFRSGDLGRLDDAGNLVYLGRANESFECGGLVVFPAEIEKAVAELPGVDDCVAFGLPDPIFGNLVSVACVAGGEITAREIIRHARARLPKHLWPARLFLRESFPHLTSGKVDRRGLVADIIG